MNCFSTLVKADTCDCKGSIEHILPERATIRDLLEIQQPLARQGLLYFEQ